MGADGCTAGGTAELSPAGAEEEELVSPAAGVEDPEPEVEASDGAEVDDELPPVVSDCGAASPEVDPLEVEASPLAGDDVEELEASVEGAEVLASVPDGEVVGEVELDEAGLELLSAAGGVSLVLALSGVADGLVASLEDAGAAAEASAGLSAVDSVGLSAADSAGFSAVASAGCASAGVVSHLDSVVFETAGSSPESRARSAAITSSIFLKASSATLRAVSEPATLPSSSVTFSVSSFTCFWKPSRANSIVSSCRTASLRLAIIQPAMPRHASENSANADLLIPSNIRPFSSRASRRAPPVPSH